jgi:biopolymer transport protein ExbD
MRKTVHSTRPELNITSMLDVVFNLIFFFILIANFAAAERLPMFVPEFEHSLATDPTASDKVVINILPDQTAAQIAAAVKAGRRPAVHVAEIVFGLTHLKPGETVQVAQSGRLETEDRLTYLLRDAVKHDKNVLISVRADKSIQYADFPPILQAIAGAGISKINIVAVATGR